MPGKRPQTAAYWAFAAYAAAVVVLTRGQDAEWAACAMPAYAVAAASTRRHRVGRIALVTAVVAVVVPMALVLATGALPAGMTVIERSAALVLHSGSPYLPARQLSSWIAYDPYLPAMALFGLPRALGLTGAVGDPRPWLVIVTVAALAAAVWTLLPHPARYCRSCRRDLLKYTAFAVACPVMALNLAVTTTDPPVIALMVASLALARRPERMLAAAAVLGLACAMKPIAWFAIPLIAGMLRTRDGLPSAIRFIAVSAIIPVAAAIPALLADPVSAVQNAVLFPLGLTQHLTPALSLTPGDLLARVGPVGHGISVGLLIVAGLSGTVSFFIRPPRDLRAVTWRLALSLAVMFAFGPAERFGYFIYPLGLLGWLYLSAHADARLSAPLPPSLPGNELEPPDGWGRYPAADSPAMAEESGPISRRPAGDASG